MQDRPTELMLRVAAGDDRAFDELVGLVYPRLLGYFRRLGVRSSDADDLVQEVFVKIYKARHKYVPRARFTTFAFRVARNHWIDRLRHMGIQPTTISADAAGAGGDEGDRLAARLPAATPPAPEHLQSRELGAALAEAIAALGPDHREVFVLTQVEGLRYQEIAEILEVPVGTVKSRVHAAVRKLRAWLAERGFEP